MRHLKHCFTFGIGVLLVNVTSIYAQCDNCPPRPSEVPRDLALKYKGYFANIYRKTSEAQDIHSVSVDFSKQAISDFYQTNFNGGQYGDHYGINVHFISFGSVILPGHVHNNQIGLGISPANAECESDFNAFNIVNNSFNQSSARNNNTPYPNRGSKSLIEIYKSNYEFVHYNPDQSRHTKYVHFARELIETLYDFFQDPSNSGYKGIRFHFACRPGNRTFGRSFFRS